MTPNAPKTPHSSFRIPEDVKAKAQARAAAEGKTLTDVIVDALKRYGRARRSNPAIDDEKETE